MISQARVVGFSGTRAVRSPELAAAVAEAVGMLSPLYHTAFVGDCSGVDRLVLRAAPNTRLFRAAGHRPFQVVARSVRLVEELRHTSRAVLLGFPWRSAPCGLQPSAEARHCFMGYGSGTWSTIAYAAGHALRVAVWLPAPFHAPEAWAGCQQLGEWLVIRPAPRLTLAQ